MTLVGDIDEIEQFRHPRRDIGFRPAAISSGSAMLPAAVRDDSRLKC